MKRTRKIVIACLVSVLISQSALGNVTPTIHAAKKVSLSQKNISMYIGDTYKISLKNATKTVKWSSSKKKIATVNSKGKISALLAGTTTITAKHNKKSYKAKVKVKNNQISDTNLTLFNGTAWQLTIPTSQKMPTWSSSDQNVASINKNGYLITNASGSTVITAILGKEQFNCDVKVVDALSRDDFEYKTPFSSNYYDDIVSFRCCLTYHILFTKDGAEYNRGIKIGDTKKDVLDTFGYSLEMPIDDGAKARFGNELNQINAKTYIGYEVKIERIGTQYVKKHFCFDEYGTLVGICWWYSY